MTPQPNIAHSLSAIVLAEPSLTLADRLGFIADLARAVSAIHAEGQIHRAISWATVTVGADRRCLLPNLQPSVLVGGEEAVDELIPPDLRHLAPLRLPAAIADAERVLQEAGVPFDPCRIDLFQLGTLLCRLVAGISIDDYLRSPWAKSQVPSRVHMVIDRALGLDPACRYAQADEIARDVESAANPGDTEVGTPQTGQRPQTVLVRADDLPQPPIIPGELLTAVDQPGWWTRFQQRCQSLLRHHTPELLRQLQNNHQQVDAAVALYARRVQELNNDVLQGEAILAELNALAQRPENQSDFSDLQASIDEQEQQLGMMRVTRAQARARLLNLQNQRDLLSARLKAAGIGSGRHHSCNQSPETPDQDLGDQDSAGRNGTESSR